MKSIQLRDYSNYVGNLKGNPYDGTVMYMGGIPLQYELFTYSFSQMIQYNHDYFEKKLYYDTVRSSFLAGARNISSRHLIGDFVVMLDTDIQIEPDTIARMVRVAYERSVHVLTGVYLYKKAPFYPVLYTWENKRKLYQIVKDWITEDKKLDLFEVNAAGAGCLFIRKWVFDYIEQQLHEEPFQIRRPFDNPEGAFLGEDLSFFDRCRQLDIQVVCDPRIRVGHISPYAYEPGKDYEPHKIDPERLK